MEGWCTKQLEKFLRFAASWSALIKRSMIYDCLCDIVNNKSDVGVSKLIQYFVTNGINRSIKKSFQV